MVVVIVAVFVDVFLVVDVDVVVDVVVVVDSRNLPSKVCQNRDSNS